MGRKLILSDGNKRRTKNGRRIRLPKIIPKVTIARRARMIFVGAAMERTERLQESAAECYGKRAECHAHSDRCLRNRVLSDSASPIIT